jgi:hypothetical protein
MPPENSGGVTFYEGTASCFYLGVFHKNSAGRGRGGLLKTDKLFKMSNFFGKN